MRTDEELRWKTLASENIINRKWLSARKDTVQLPDGRIYDEYYVLHYPTWVNVIAETADGQLVVERQYRHTLNVVSTEICAGVVEEGETPLQGAQRELMEETGFGGGHWEELCRIAPNPSTMDNICHCFLARGVEHKGRQHFDSTEDLDVMLKSRKEVYDMLQHNQFCQALMIAPLWKYFSLFPL